MWIRRFRLMRRTITMSYGISHKNSYAANYSMTKQMLMPYARQLMWYATRKNCGGGRGMGMCLTCSRPCGPIQRHFMRTHTTKTFEESRAAVSNHNQGWEHWYKWPKTHWRNSQCSKKLVVCRLYNLIALWICPNPLAPLCGTAVDVDLMSE